MKLAITTTGASILMAFALGGCTPKLTGAQVSGPVVVRNDPNPQQAYVVTSVWDAGWGSVGTVCGPRKQTLQYNQKTDQATLMKTAYHAPDDRDAYLLRKACSFLRNAGYATSARDRLHFVLSLDPPIVGYVSASTQGNDSRQANYPFISVADDSLLLDGYVVCKKGFWSAAKKADEASILKSYVTRDFPLAEKVTARSLIVGAPWTLE